jgi:zinc and cadmium transporter
VDLGALGWIVGAGVLMSLLALSGAVVLVLTGESFDRLVLPLVALAGGSLLGGALFHLLPSGVSELGNDLPVYAWLAGGVLSFFVLEQFLHWHHCHRSQSAHRPLGLLILVADGLHNFIGGLAVGTAFVVDIRLGIVTWLVAAAHEIPQEMGDLGILVHAGWSPRSALAYNMASALTFLAGGVIAWAASSAVNTAVLLPFAAGNFLYIALADLVPELTTPAAPHEKVVLVTGFAGGLVLLGVLAGLT